MSVKKVLCFLIISTFVLTACAAKTIIETVEVQGETIIETVEVQGETVIETVIVQQEVEEGPVTISVYSHMASEPINRSVIEQIFNETFHRIPRRTCGGQLSPGQSISEYLDKNEACMHKS